MISFETLYSALVAAGTVLSVFSVCEQDNSKSYECTPWAIKKGANLFFSVTTSKINRF